MDVRVPPLDPLRNTGSDLTPSGAIQSNSPAEKKFPIVPVAVALLLVAAVAVFALRPKGENATTATTKVEGTLPTEPTKQPETSKTEPGKALEGAKPSDISNAAGVQTGAAPNNTANNANVFPNSGAPNNAAPNNAAPNNAAPNNAAPKPGAVDTRPKWVPKTTRPKNTGPQEDIRISR